MSLDFYDVLLFSHLISLVVGFGAVIVVDSFGLAWMLKLFGVTLKLVTQVAEITQKLIWLGFFGLVVSGALMFYERGLIAVAQNLHWMKFFLVAMVGVNGVYLHTIKKRMEGVVGEVVPKEVMFRMALASTISQVGWWGATLIGFYLSSYGGAYLAWPQSPIMVMLIIISCIAVFWAGGKAWSKN